MPTIDAQGENPRIPPEASRRVTQHIRVKPPPLDVMRPVPFLHRLADKPIPLFACFLVFVLSITIFQAPPWPGLEARFTFGMGLAWAGLALLAGLLSRRPSLFIPSFVAACTGPHHRVAVLYAFLCGVAMLGFVLWKNRRAPADFLRRAFRERGFGFVAAVAVYAVALWLLRMGDSTDGWSFPALGASMFAVPLAVYSFLWLPWTAEEREKAAVNTILYVSAVAVVVLIVPALGGRFEQYTVPAYVFYKTASAVHTLPFTMGWVNPDSNGACFRSAHYAAVALFILALCFFACGRYTGKKRMFVAAAVALFAALMGENAHALPAVAAAAVLTALITRSRGVSHPARWAAGITGASVVMSVLVVAGFYSMNDYLSGLPKAQVYRAAAAYAFAHPGRFLVGEGPASFGSHAARKRLPPGLGDERVYPMIPRTVSPAYRAVLEQVRGPRAYTTVHRPISGLIPFFVEWGLLGAALLLATLYRLLRTVMETIAAKPRPWTATGAAAAAASFPMLFILLGFRPYLEYPDVMSVASVLFLLGGREPA